MVYAWMNQTSVYHIDSVESTSKWWGRRAREDCRYTILTLWSQLQNKKASASLACSLYHIDSVESTSKFLSPLIRGDKRVYHIDSVESTSKSIGLNIRSCSNYTILTLWSQLQNASSRSCMNAGTIPYWLCGVNFKIHQAHACDGLRLYHIELQNSSVSLVSVGVFIPYWLCGVNFKIIIPV